MGQARAGLRYEFVGPVAAHIEDLPTVGYLLACLPL